MSEDNVPFNKTSITGAHFKKSIEVSLVCNFCLELLTREVAVLSALTTTVLADVPLICAAVEARLF